MSYLAAQVFMIAIKVNHHFIIHQLGYATCVLPVNTQTNIGLLHFIKIVVDNNIGTALQTIFNKFFNGRKFSLGYLCYIFAQAQPILTKIAVEVFCLIIFPFKFLILNPVFTKFNCVYLCIRFHTGKDANTG